VIAEVVDVDAQHDAGAVGIGDRHEHVHQVGLAVEAPIGVVDPVCGPGHLVGLDRRPTQAPLPRQRTAVVALRPGERR